MGNNDQFDMTASRYDTSEQKQIANISVEVIREYLDDTKGKTAVDFGCGTGLVGMNLLAEFKSILFIDKSYKMIEQVEEKIVADHIQNAKTMWVDLDTDYASTVKSDYIVMAQVLHHIKDTKQILSRLYDMLNESGHLIITDFDYNEKIPPNRIHPGFKQSELVDLVKEIGFREATSKTFYSGKNIFMHQDASMFIVDAVK